jgi:hypothetical protein
MVALGRLLPPPQVTAAVGKAGLAGLEVRAVKTQQIALGKVATAVFMAVFVAAAAAVLATAGLATAVVVASAAFVLSGEMAAVILLTQVKFEGLSWNTTSNLGAAEKL